MMASIINKGRISIEYVILRSRSSTESSFLARVEAPSFGDPASFFAHTLCERGEPTQPS